MQFSAKILLWQKSCQIIGFAPNSRVGALPSGSTTATCVYLNFSEKPCTVLKMIWCWELVFPSFGSLEIVAHYYQWCQVAKHLSDGSRFTYIGDRKPRRGNANPLFDIIDQEGRVPLNTPLHLHRHFKIYSYWDNKAHSLNAKIHFAIVANNAIQDCFHLQFRLRKLFVLTVRYSITVLWIKSQI